MLIDIDLVKVNPEQPREDIGRDELAALAENIRTVGLINPIAVMAPNGDGLFTIIDGERRWRACKMLGWRVIAADVREVSVVQDGKAASMHEMAVSANMHRLEMNPLEVAKAIWRMREEGKEITEIAKLFGKSEYWVQIRLDIRNFPGEVQALFASKRIVVDGSSVAALGRITDRHDLVRLAKRFAEKEMNTRTIRYAVDRYLHGVGGGKLSQGRPPKSQVSGSNLFTQVPIEGVYLKDDIRLAVKAVCGDCYLAEFAAKGGCKDCPLVDFVNRMVRDA